MPCPDHLDTPPKALICDLGNVLIFFDRSRSYRALGRLLDRPWKEIRNCIEQSDILQRFEIGSLDDDSFRGELRKLVGDDDGVLSAESIDQAWGDIFRPNPPMIATISSLKNLGLGMALLSDTNHIHFAYAEKHYPEVFGLFDRLVLSYREHLNKSDARIFHRAVQEVTSSDSSILPSEILFIDDRPDYVERARSLGMRACVYRSHIQTVSRLQSQGLAVD